MYLKQSDINQINPLCPSMDKDKNNQIVFPFLLIDAHKE